MFVNKCFTNVQKCIRIVSKCITKVLTRPTLRQNVWIERPGSMSNAVCRLKRRFSTFVRRQSFDAQMRRRRRRFDVQMSSTRKSTSNSRRRSAYDVINDGIWKKQKKIEIFKICLILKFECLRELYLIACDSENDLIKCIIHKEWMFELQCVIFDTDCNVFVSANFSRVTLYEMY
jgi:hypothetical protein